MPGNPLLAGSMYLDGSIERMGTGTRGMIRHCIDAGLPEPGFSASDGFETIIRRATAEGWGVPTMPGILPARLEEAIQGLGQRSPPARVQQVVAELCGVRVICPVLGMRHVTTMNGPACIQSEKFHFAGISRDTSILIVFRYVMDM